MTRWLLLFIFLAGCAQKGGFRVAATPVPHAEMLKFIQPDLKKQGIDLVIVTTDDYNVPNRALSDGDVAANFFQHIPFLEEQIKEFGYKIEEVAKVEIEPMGLYSKKYTNLTNIPQGATIAIPNDPSNEARALLLLAHHQLIGLNTQSFSATVENISYNPHRYKFIEVTAATLPRSLPDVDAAIINTNYALQAHLNPIKDALILEDKDSAYANVIVVRDGDESLPQIKALVEAMTSEKMREFILKKYKGAVFPAF
ncbi:MAG: hypothetical protein ACD_17C00309G0002 [uncultured bacterium]|nr:MAG: hypothetical protein ACD_17C00309G0002 [uncultured bacterium]OGN55262.1 MAG: hypothetical protein A2796_01900 [Chlamydiae bacterium RIFCSPHIGHO2_01_FULL_44_39]OGN58547.1 MAG: hypothetical protein A3C42_04655 [Chlamydiae bacterium RIFCSPHIGHO2_02_FULL_45_9]OGN59777.1 MAG: hypothetical protein A3D96_06755 [Chlamydiae bacterium RIFCSPHIGHO2_12_FULL_44_59]OGN65875.1 MAG: hypothetical protein A2978_05710 [Chlamydiae bacterium RIFCSPLOWO2_01_FULL_44_52]OGN68285.1 MAG: hypothetical protein A3